MEKVLIIGGPGNISTSCIESLIEAKYSIAIFTKKSDREKNPDGSFTFFADWDKKYPTPYLTGIKSIEKGIKFYYGDRNNKEQLKFAIQDFKPDLIADFICFAPEQAKDVIDLVYGKVSHYVFISTVDIYGYPTSKIPMSENDSYKTPVSEYAKNKKKCEEIFLKSYDKNKFPLTIARPSYSFGPIIMISLFSRFGGRYLVPRLRNKKPVLVPGDGNTLFHCCSAYNTGRMIYNLLTSEKTVGKSYNCAHECINTQDSYINLLAETIGIEPVIVHIPVEYLIKLKNKEINDSIITELTQFNIGFSVENFKRDFPDFTWQPLETVFREYLRWNDMLKSFANLSEEIIEDKIIKAWLECTSNFQLDK